MMRPIYFFLLMSASLYPLHTGSFSAVKYPHAVKEIPSGNDDGRRNGDTAQNQDNAPKLKIELPGAPGHLSWNTQVRYMISVSDPKDGESRYEEIDARACIMEIEYFPVEEEGDVNELIKRSRETEEHKGLFLMKRSTCFGCHADKTRLAGPSFAEIAGRYENNSATTEQLGSHILGGSSGIWGSQVMPSHPDLTLKEAAQIAQYILEQGGNKNRWIYPGLEGTFRTIQKPEDHHQGIYVLTASYTSTSDIRGEESVVFKIK